MGWRNDELPSCKLHRPGELISTPALAARTALVSDSMSYAPWVTLAVDEERGRPETLLRLAESPLAPLVALTTPRQ